MKYHISNDHKTNLKVLIEDESECAITITVPVVEGALPNLEMFCESCNYKTSNRKYWDRHLKGHSININIKDIIVCCNFCDFNTNHEDSLEGHVATKHPRKRKINDDQEENNTEKNDLQNSDEKSSLVNEFEPKEKQAKTDSTTSNDINVSKNSVKSTDENFSCPECLFETDDLDKITDHRNKFH